MATNKKKEQRDKTTFPCTEQRSDQSKSERYNGREKKKKQSVIKGC